MVRLIRIKWQTTRRRPGSATIGHFIWSIFEKSQNLSTNFHIFLKFRHLKIQKDYRVCLFPVCLECIDMSSVQIILVMDKLCNWWENFFCRWCLIFHAFFIFFPSKITVKNFQKKKLIFLKKGKMTFFLTNFFLNVCLLWEYTICLLENFINIIFRPLRIF